MALDVGNAAITRTSWQYFDARTHIDKNNPCNGNGTITQIQIFLLLAANHATLGLLYNTSGASYTQRSSVYVGAIAAGSTQTFGGLTLAVQTNDVIGCYDSDDNNECVRTELSGGAGTLYYVGNGFDGSSHSYSVTDADAISSIGGTGDEAAGWTNIAKACGVAAADIAKVHGVAVADIAKINGVAV